MKKKFKLFTTIASLCLAVALMAFGVYAANITSLKVSGTISFSATEIDGTWTEATVTITNATFADGTSGTTKTLSDIAGGGEEKVGNIKVTNVDEDVTITVEVKFTNTSNEKDAKITATYTCDEGAGYTLSAVNSDGSAAKNSGSIVAAKVVFTFKVTDKAQTISDINWSASFAASVNED